MSERQWTYPDLDRLQRDIHRTDCAVDAALALLRQAMTCRRPPKKLVREAVRLLEKAR